MRAKPECAFQLAMFPKNNTPFAVTSSERLSPLVRQERLPRSLVPLQPAISRWTLWAER